MKRKVFIGMLIASVISMSTTVFAAPTAAFGDSSKGNHPLAPYAKSDIIVPRPKTSQYSELQRYPLNETKLQGHWAEKYIVYLTQRGCMDAEAIQPNAPITYADFANVVARLGLEPVEYNGGYISYKVFNDYALWNTEHPTAKAALICGEAGVWGNPSEANDTMICYPNCRLGDQAQRQYIAVFLVNMLNPVAVSSGYQKNFKDSNRSSSPFGKAAMDRLVQEGIISGYADGTIRPDAAVTKAELAVMLYKVLEKSQFDMTKINDNLYANYQGYYWEEEEKLLKLVNEDRRKNGIRELKYDADLNALCEIKI